jgi:hypothetical protein
VTEQVTFGEHADDDLILFDHWKRRDASTRHLKGGVTQRCIGRGRSRARRHDVADRELAR